MKDYPETLCVPLDGKFCFTCPDCGFHNLLSVDDMRHRKLHVKVKCTCGHSFKVQLEFRLSTRRETDLDGHFKLKSEVNNTSSKVKLVNLSMKGVCLEFTAPHHLSIGDQGLLKFTLDDPKKAEIIKDLTIRQVSKNQIGCEFIDQIAHQKDLGFYLSI
jgi:hypothetical protein